MAELALLGYNVSLPEVDKGDDVFVVNDDTGQLWRLQVKGATPQKSGGKYQVVTRTGKNTWKHGSCGHFWIMRKCMPNQLGTEAHID